MPEPVRVALRIGAVSLALGAVALVLVALFAPSGPSTRATPVPEPSSVALPDLGLFGGSTLVHGASGEPGVAPRDLGCRLLTADGREQSTARMSVLPALGAAGVTVDGRALHPLFAVSSYPAGSTLQCPGLASLAPVAVGPASTFGALGSLVRAVAAAGAVLAALLSVVGFVVTRRRPA